MAADRLDLFFQGVLTEPVLQILRLPVLPLAHSLLQSLDLRMNIELFCRAGYYNLLRGICIAIWVLLLVLAHYALAAADP